MKRVLIASDDEAENTDTPPTSPKRYITLQSSFVLESGLSENVEQGFSTYFDPQHSISEIATISDSAVPTITDLTINEARNEIVPDDVAPCHNESEQGKEQDVKNHIFTTDEPVPAEYGAEEQVPFDSTPGITNSDIELLNGANDTLEKNFDPTSQRMPPLSKTTTSISKWPGKFMILMPKPGKKTIYVYKPVKSNVGELGNPLFPPKEYLENDCCIIQTLMKRQFTQKSWSDAERIDIISNGPPQPFLTRLNIGPSEYKRFSWLAGCVDGAKLYCWYCLLFSSAGVWSTSAMHRVVLIQAANKHNTASVHIEAQMLLRHWNSKMRPGLSRGVTETLDVGAEKTMRNESSSGILSDTNRKAPTVDSDCLIQRLLKNSFVHGTWTEKERENIIEKGRPKLGNMNAVQQQSTFHRYLSKAQQKTPWLTGSEELSKLFCWPCLLFCSQGAWAKIGYDNLNLLGLGVHRHEITQQHLEACLRLKVWEQQVKRKSFIQKLPYEQHNEAVERSRDFMKYVIDVICYFKKKKENTDVSYGNTLKLMTIISRNDGKLKHYLRTRFFFEDEMISITKSVEACLKQRIYKEAVNSRFVSVILNGVHNKPWLSVILRYVTDNGEVQERFLQFIEFKYDAPIQNLLENVFKVIGFLGYAAKLVGFTHDGFAIKPLDLAYFNSKITEKYPPANFFHYCDHNLKILLQQSLSQVSHCRNFIHRIQDLVMFFERNPIAKTSLTIIDQEICEDKNWDYVWNFTSGIIKTVNDHYPAIIKLFERMIRSADAWSTETVAEAHNFITFLKSLENRFLIKTFSRIFDDIDELTRTMESGFDVSEWKQVAQKTSEAVIKTRCDDFEVIFQSAWDMLPSGKEYAYDLRYAEKFDGILESASLFIHCRTKDLEKWAFMELVTNPLLDEPSKFSLFSKFVGILKRQFPGEHFDRLPKQLMFFKDNALFKGKTLDELIKYINDLDMVHALPALHKFAKLTLAVPFYPVPTSTGTPAMKRIAFYINNKKHFTSTDAMMFVEKDLLTKLQNEPEFHEEVINYFADNFGGEHLKFQKSTGERS